MITKFKHIHVGSPSGEFNRIAYDCINLAKENKCEVVWEVDDLLLSILEDYNLRDIQEEYFTKLVLDDWDNQ